jgi:hypothetical protein
MVQRYGTVDSHSGPLATGTAEYLSVRLEQNAQCGDSDRLATIAIRVRLVLDQLASYAGSPDLGSRVVHNDLLSLSYSSSDTQVQDRATWAALIGMSKKRRNIRNLEAAMPDQCQLTLYGGSLLL